MLTRQELISNILALAIALITALWISTQAFAWWLGWQGYSQPQHSIFFIPYMGDIYWPWSIVQWWMWWRSSLPAVNFGLGGGVIIFLASAVSIVKPLFVKDKIGTEEEWGREKDLIKHNLLNGSRPKSLGGAILGMLSNKKLIVYRGDGHILISGGPGSGKTSCAIIPIILSIDSESILVNDTKGDLFGITAAHRSSLGPTCFFDPTHSDSVRFNPFEEVRLGTSDEIRDLQNLITILVSGSGTRSDSSAAQYYHTGCINILLGLCLHVIHDIAGEHLSFGLLLEKLAAFEDRSLRRMLKSKSGTCKRLAEAFAAENDNARSGTISTATRALSVFNDPLVCEKTGVSDFRINDMMAGSLPMSFYIQVRQSDQDRLRPLLLLITRQITEKLTYALRETDDGRKKKWKLRLIKEEFADSREDFTADKLKVIREYGISAVMVTQSIKELKSVYGSLQAIDDNCYAIIGYSSIGRDEQDYFSANSGQKEEEVKRVSHKYGLVVRDIGHSESVSKHKTPLLTRSAVRGLPPDRQMLVINGCERIFLPHKPAWFLHPLLKDRGANVRAGEEPAGQSSWVLDKLPGRSEVSRHPRPVAVAVNASEDVGAKDGDGKRKLRNIMERTGWSARDVCSLVFDDGVSEETFRRWLSSYGRVPDARISVVSAISDHVDKLPSGDPEDVAAGLLRFSDGGTIISKLKNGELVS